VMGLMQDLAAMNSVIVMLAKVGDASRALEVLSKMEGVLSKLEGACLQPNKTTMTSLITACAPVGDASKAVQALSRLGMHLDQGTMTYVLKSICRAGRSFRSKTTSSPTSCGSRALYPTVWPTGRCCCAAADRPPHSPRAARRYLTHCSLIG